MEVDKKPFFSTKVNKGLANLQSPKIKKIGVDKSAGRIIGAPLVVVAVSHSQNIFQLLTIMQNVLLRNARP